MRRTCTEVDYLLSQAHGPGLQSSLATPKVTASHQTAIAPSRPIHTDDRICRDDGAPVIKKLVGVPTIAKTRARSPRS